MRTAVGLADAIKDTFGITANLVEGHNGIYEVGVNSDIVYTNRGKCSRLPTTGEVLIRNWELQSAFGREKNCADRGIPNF